MEAYSPIEEIEPRRLADGADYYVVNLCAFFDDAGTSESPVVACAGYLALARRWNAFSPKWRHLLRSYHIPIEKFSMKKFAHSVGPFKGWNEPKRQSFMGQALTLMRHFIEAGFVGVIRKSDYDIHLSEELKSRVGGHFPFCAEMCIGLVEAYTAQRAGRNLKDEPSEHIDYVFEKGSPGAGRVHAAFEGFYWNIDRLWCRKFDTEDKGAAELHAADILAYETVKNFKDMDLGKTTIRHPFETLIFGIPHFILGPDGADIAAIDEQLRMR
jgi:hypothetical protein